MKNQIIKTIPCIMVFVLMALSLTSCFIEIPFGGDDDDTAHTHNFIEKTGESFIFKECTICGFKTDERPINNESGHIHNNVWVIDVAPTYTSSGVKHMECDECGFKSKENTIIYRLISDEEIYDGAIDPSWGTDASFKTLADLDSFCKENKEKLEGSFLCLDLSSASEDGIQIKNPYDYPSYVFDYESEKDGKYVNSILVTDYNFYSQELGTDTDINMDVLAHSLTLKLYSYPQTKIKENLRYEFFSYKSEKLMWNYVAKIYSGDTCVAYMYYYTRLDIEHEWLVSFLDKYIVVINKTTIFDLFS